jgi:predicted acetyltransferase
MLPFRLFWIHDGDFCGSINLRFVRGSEELPPCVSGHVGSAVVPWKRRRGYATRVRAKRLPIVRAAGPSPTTQWAVAALQTLTPRL